MKINTTQQGDDKDECIVYQEKRQMIDNDESFHLQ